MDLDRRDSRAEAVHSRTPIKLSGSTMFSWERAVDWKLSASTEPESMRESSRLLEAELAVGSHCLSFNFSSDQHFVLSLVKSLSLHPVCPEFHKTKAPAKAPAKLDVNAAVKAAALSTVAATPEKPKPKIKSETPKPPRTPAKKKDPGHVAEFLPLAKDEGVTIPVTVKVDGGNVHANPTSSGGYHLLLKLDAPNSFQLTKTIILDSGPYAGQQAIVIRPSKPFEFLGLPDEARNRVYRFYFASAGSTTDRISLDGKRTSNREIYAKTYAGGSKYRVALLAVNKQITAEALPLLYLHPLRLENTALTVDFLSELSKSTVSHLTSIEIKSWDGYKFLEAFGKERGNKEAGIEVLSFGKAALQMKDSGATPKNYTVEMVEVFKEELKAKMK
ncbi:uncharacterized protein MYCGRDRAFT_93404 [Zymoseptoria tritici IPO323]|uniref:Uncharacterized protein n=1 Tax=Zymoseptoria tritici (strain CBS 115943 / IPO323) TaxID=336722 RepID=F9XBR9_ZYMTI|nr:uncharacterized protein MYCGRDRAFT_93404 [Zymoseptoria tritici IPO323]EGP87492.1 hypothetical protein MYCGRDRAFT_93404 [Zymoseptoria tritici IPO323]